MSIMRKSSEREEGRREGEMVKGGSCQKKRERQVYRGAMEGTRERGTDEGKERGREGR